MHENEDFAPGMIFFSGEIFKGSVAVQYFTHGNLWEKLLFHAWTFHFKFMHG